MKIRTLVLLLLTVFACKEANNEDGLYRLLSSKETGIDFSNEITETEKINYFTYPYLFMGGGVALGDFNNDGLDDVFFTGNQVNNKLYLNQGSLSFVDITEKARLQGGDKWYTGVSLVDINADGWLDIYLSVAGILGSRDNELYINNGNLTFTESARDYGIADPGYSYHGSFFDYDLDGDLDLLVINYTPTPFKSLPEHYRYRMDHIEDAHSDKLYENVNGKYVDVTSASGISNFGLSISASVSDFNNDGLPDIYICNDFASPDYFYINQGNKTFREVLQAATNHTAMYSMGSDVADFNEDGLMDLIQLDMNPADNYRNKANMASMNIPLFWAQVDNGLHYQYMHNVLQLNRGVVDSIPRFSDISQMAGISSTDWSWSVLAMDVDNDAQRDIFITNGTRRDINNKDFFNNLTKGLSFASDKMKLEESKKIPSNPIPNYLYRNKGDLIFEDISVSAGIAQPGFSNGMAYGDLDNDGDLDLVINNIDKEALVYENTTSNKGDFNYLQVQLKGEKTNPSGIGARIRLVAQGRSQHIDQMPFRGYLSTVSEKVHFGLGTANQVDSVFVKWPSGAESVLTNIKANQLLVVHQKDAQGDRKPKLPRKALFTMVDSVAQIVDFKHQENDFDDFDVQILLPHKMSQFGPAMEVADFNSDGLDDLFFGGSSGYAAKLFFQQQGGHFEEQDSTLFSIYRIREDLDALAFDFDGDDDLDLYIVSGGNEFDPQSENYQDRLYINDGHGNFRDGSDLLPKHSTSGSVVKAMDFDRDGDLDVFVGTRLLPHNYPFSEASHLYENTGSSFKDVTETIAPDLMTAGMVTDAVWMDIDKNGRQDLVLVGEWMAPLVLKQNTAGHFKKISNAHLGLENMHGWWFSIEKGDLDKDGDEDLILGNLGDNYKYQATPESPFRVYAKDFNASGSTDIVLSYKQDGKYYPVRGKQCSSQQIPELKTKFKDYNSFAKADIYDVYSENELSGAMELEASTFSSYALMNENGTFVKKRLPNEAQLSSINDIVMQDLDEDGDMEIMLVGNLYTSEVETTRNDASYGSLLDFDLKTGEFMALPYRETGLFIRGDVKKIDNIRIAGDDYLITALNDDNVSLIKKNMD